MNPGLPVTRSDDFRARMRSIADTDVRMATRLGRTD